RWDQPAYSLSYASRRRLEIARAMATEPRLLLLDEPAAGMNPKETHEITELIGKLRDDGGYTILVIEHDMHVVEGISDRVVALDHGVKIAEGSFEEVATNERVVEAYLGLRGAKKEDLERVYSLFPLLRERRRQLAGTLSGGEQQMVAMGRALMSRPKLLLMDEPSMGLAPILVERNFEIIKQVHESGVAVLVV